MKLLLDTCTFLWLVDGHSRITDRVRNLFVEPANEVFLSSVSSWEISVKHRLGRLQLSQPPAQYVPHYRRAHRIQTLALDENSTLQLERLPDIHRDPFDRMLICQAIQHGLVLLTPDPEIQKYPIRFEW